MLGPLVVGLLGDHRSGPIGSIGDAMSLLFLATLIPVLVIGARYVGETKGLNLRLLDEVLA